METNNLYAYVHPTALRETHIKVMYTIGRGILHARAIIR